MLCHRLCGWPGFSGVGEPPKRLMPRLPGTCSHRQWGLLPAQPVPGVARHEPGEPGAEVGCGPGCPARALSQPILSQGPWKGHGRVGVGGRAGPWRAWGYPGAAMLGCFLRPQPWPRGLWCCPWWEFGARPPGGRVGTRGRCAWPRAVHGDASLCGWGATGCCEREGQGTARPVLSGRDRPLAGGLGPGPLRERRRTPSPGWGQGPAGEARRHLAAVLLPHAPQRVTRPRPRVSSWPGGPRVTASSTCECLAGRAQDHGLVHVWAPGLAGRAQGTWPCLVRRSCSAGRLP